MIIPDKYKDYKFTQNKASMDKLSKVKSRLISQVYEIFVILEKKGWQPIVAEGLRSLKEEQGKINEGNAQISNPKRSRHTTGDAVDIVDKRYGWEGPAASLSFKFWRDVGDAVHTTSKGVCEWGGDWHSFKDVAHVQLSRAVSP